MGTLRPLGTIGDDLRALHVEASALLLRVLAVHPTLWMTLRRAPVRALETEVEALTARFLTLDAELGAHARPHDDFNSDMRLGQLFPLYVAVRDSTRGVLNDATGALGSIRSQLDVRGALAVGLIALAISMISAASDLAGWLLRAR